MFRLLLLFCLADAVFPAAALAAGSATFQGVDTATQGSWKGVYGQDGYIIANDSNVQPAYAAVATTAPPYTWAASSSDVRSLQKSASATDRIASTFYSSTSFSFDFNPTDSLSHRVAIYCLDLETNTRAQTISILDAGTNAVLSSQPMTAFHNGVYSIWSLQGHVIIKITYTGGLNAVVSGLFFGGGGALPAAPTVSMTGPAAGTVSGTVALSATAASTAGLASVQFQVDGVNLGSPVLGTGPNFSTQWNTATVTNTSHTVRAIASDTLGQTTPSTGVTVTVSNPVLPPTVSISAPVAGTVSGQITVTATASSNQGIANVQFRLDGTDLGAPVTGPGPGYSTQWNTTTASSGQHALTAVATDSQSQQTTSAPVTVTVSNTGGSQPSAVFVKTDSATKGTWKGTYGGEGYIIANDSNSPPSYATVAITGATAYTWAASSTDPRSLQKGASSTDRIASTFYTANSLSLDINLTDGQTHQVALYCLDLETTTRVQNISILNAATNAVLASQPLSGFNGGVYSVWNLQGHVIVRVTYTSGLNAVLSGAFFGASPAQVPPPTVSMTNPSAGTVAGTVALTASAQSTAGIASVQFQVDGANQGAPVTGAAFTTQWNTTAVANGSHTVRAIATDTLGQSTTSAGVSVTVLNPVLPPTVSITSPSGGTISGQVTVTANAVGAAGIASVQFQLDGSPLGAAVTGAGPNFSTQWNTTLAANGPHTLTAIATDNQSQTTPSAGVSVNVSNLPGSQPTATFIGLDTSTKGNWKGAYGQDGYIIANDSNSPPSYATVTATGAPAYTWVASTIDPRGLLKAASATDRIASAFYTGSSFSFDINLTDGQPHRVALYCLDLDSTSRSQTISILNASTNAVLHSQPMSSFNGGVYAAWTLQGHVIVRVNYTGGLNAVVSGLFFGGSGPTAPPTVSLTSPAAGTVSGTVTLTATASSTTGLASVQFQLDGANLNAAVTGVGPTFSTQWVTTPALNGQHVLRAIAADTLGQRTTSAGVTVAVANNVSPPAVSIITPTGGSVLGTVTVSANATSTQGIASVQFQLDGANLGSPAVGSGPTYSIQWNTTTASNTSHTLTAVAADTLGQQATSPAVTLTISNPGAAQPSATFLGLDTTTRGSWKNVFGFDGYVIPNDSNVVPAYATFAVTGAQAYTWWPTSSDPRVLQKGASATDRIASTFFSASTFSFDINLTDGLTHQVAFYCLDLETNSRAQTISILNATTNAVLSTQPMSAFNNGQYAVWNLQGHVIVKVTYVGGLNAVVGGVFFGGSPPPPPPPTISITSPLSGTLSGTVAVTATASATAGLASVQFKVDGANLNALLTGAGPSFSTQWSTIPVQNGVHSLTAVATDNLGQQSTSPAVQATVFNLAPGLSVSSAAATFSAFAGAANPAGQNVSITNIGGGVLNWTASKAQAWLTLSAASGTAPSSLGLTVNTTGLAVGTYTDTVTIASDGATGSPKTVAVTLTVAAQPQLSLSGSSLTFAGTVGAANPVGQNVSITNSGGGTVNWTATKTQTWLTLSAASGTAPSSLGATVNTTGLAAGTYTDTITISASGALGSPQTIAITLTLIPPPKLTLSGNSLSFNGTAGIAIAAGQNVSITNTGGGTLNWTATKTQSWLTLTAASGTAPSSLGVSVDTTGLSAATYTDTVTITSPGATSSPQTVAITLILIPPPHLTVSGNSLSFTATVGAANPAGQNVNITNTGGGSLSWTAAKGQSWLNLSASSGTAPSSLGITPNTAGLAAGTFTDTVTITATGAVASPQTVAVTLTMIPPPVISLSTSGLNPAGTVLSPPPDPQSITIANSGGGTLSWTATKTQSWLVLSASSGTAPSTLVASYNITALAAGSYSDVITIHGVGATNSPQTVTVNLIMSPPVTPIALWTFDTATISGHTIGDTSGDNINGNMLGNVTSVAGKIGQALSFDGTSNYIFAGNDARLAMKSDLTIAAWVRTTNHTRPETLISKYDFSGSEDGYIFQVTAAGSLGLHVGGTNNPGNRDILDGTTNTVNDGNWHHVACIIRPGQDVSFYVDGGLSSVFYFTIWGSATNGSITIGGPAFGLGANFFTGQMDDLRVYARALSTKEMVQLYGATVTTVSGGELLYNGISMPKNFPPPIQATQVPRSPYYINNPPRVIPIDVGRQLFVDDFLVDQSTLQRTQHRPVIRTLPVLTQGSPISAGAWYDPSDHKYKTWYYDGVTPDYRYAVSDDGINWNLPTFPDAMVPNTNEVVSGGDTIWLDLQEVNPARRYKSFQVDPGAAKIYVYFSPDGIHWSPRQDYNIKSISDRTSVFWNAFRNVWVNSDRGTAAYFATPNRPGFTTRARFYSESPDLVNWNPADPARTFWTGADDQDPPYYTYGPTGEFPELYNLDCVAYESVMVGLFSWFHPGLGYKDYTRPGPVLVEIGAGFSRDGFSWVRPTRGSGPTAFIPADNVQGSWNGFNTQSAGGGFLVVGDELWFYFSARSEKKPNNGNFSTGLATMRRDGFYSMDAGPSEATLTTRPVRFSGSHMFVNVDDSAGQLRVEVLDANGNVIPAFSKANSVSLSVNSTLQEVTWPGASIGTLAGQSVKFKFYLTNGRLYSFWVTPSAAGASNGYVAAGGPGFTGVTDTIGNGH